MKESEVGTDNHLSRRLSDRNDATMRTIADNAACGGQRSVQRAVVRPRTACHAATVRHAVAAMPLGDGCTGFNAGPGLGPQVRATAGNAMRSARPAVLASGTLLASPASSQPEYGKKCRAPYRGSFGCCSTQSAQGRDTDALWAHAYRRYSAAARGAQRSMQAAYNARLRDTDHAACNMPRCNIAGVTCRVADSRRRAVT
jgi:hypothetical protein